MAKTKKQKNRQRLRNMGVAVVASRVQESPKFREAAEKGILGRKLQRRFSSPSFNASRTNKELERGWW